ncbi:ester cyclase [Iamia sp.]|uniref:ester cyclase n=1 Tax=Iamia sp. TaxID=2722710 RepID=UPI002C68F2F2|nr:ester cyclase [Iamia sp.]HXH57029.1 ester cyclase [Iamia sp.]
MPRRSFTWRHTRPCGDFAGHPPTGREFRCRMAAVFEFAGDRITCERVYFDSGTILRQLGLAGAGPER